MSREFADKLRLIATDLRKLSTSSPVDVKQLSRLSDKLDSLIGHYLRPELRHILPRAFADNLESGKVSIFQRLREDLREQFDEKDFYEEACATILDSIRLWKDIARGINEGHENDIAEYYGFGSTELAEIKAELKKKGWLD